MLVTDNSLIKLYNKIIFRTSNSIDLFINLDFKVALEGNIIF